MIVIDLASNYDHDLWQRTLERIASGHDPLKKNYVDLDPRKFLCFPALVDRDDIICFSGLEVNQDRWGPCARINTRMWIDPRHRHQYLTKMDRPEKFLNTRYLLPVQLARAQEAGIDTVFISREGNYRRFLNRYVKLIHHNTGHSFTVLPHRYAVCGDISPTPPSCRQLIAIHSFSGDLSTWHSSMSRHVIIEDLATDQ
jgi:hypothetical protein